MTSHTVTIGHTVTFEEIAPIAIGLDDRVQRALSEHKVGKLASKLDVRAIGTPELSERENGSRVVLDAQHRIQALIRRGYGEEPIQCRIHHGLSLAEEAELFLKFNDRHVVNPLERFRIGVTAQIPECVKLNNIAVHHGFRIAVVSKNGLTCVEELKKVHRAGGTKDREGRPEVVDMTLATLAKAWGTEGSATRETVAGVGGLLNIHNGQVDQNRLAKRLAQLSGGPSGVKSRAHTLYDIGRAKSISAASVTVVRDIYNEGLRKAGKLSE